MSTTILVQNINLNDNEDDVKSYFEKLGNIIEVEIIKNKKGCSRGYGFITFAKPEDAQSSILMFDKKVFHGKKISVQLMQKEEETDDNIDDNPIKKENEIYSIVNNLIAVQMEKLEKNISEKIKSIHDENHIYIRQQQQQQQQQRQKTEKQILYKSIPNNFHLKTKTIELNNHPKGDYWTSCGSPDMFNDYNENYIYLFKSFTVRSKNFMSAGFLYIGIRNNIVNPTSEVIRLGDVQAKFSIHASLCENESSKTIAFKIQNHCKEPGLISKNIPDDLFNAIKCQNMLTNYMDIGFRLSYKKSIIVVISYYEIQK